MKNFLKHNEALNYFNKLSSSINWRQEEIKYYGKIYPVPRKTAWYGYEGFNYSYSGITCFPEIWTKELLEIKKEDQYYKKLKTNYDYLVHKYQLQSNSFTPLQFFKHRPDNFPTIRVSQLANVY